MLQPDVYDVEQCSVTEYLVNKCKELKTARAHLLLYVRGSNTAATAATVASAVAAASAPHDGADSLRAQLEAFATSRETRLDMSASLTSAERARVHQIASALGLSHQSFGEGTARYIRITKLGCGDAGGAESASVTDDMDVDDASPEGGSGAVGGRGLLGEQQQPAGHPFGLMRLVVGDANSARRSAGSGVELVLLPYNFTKLMELLEQQLREATAIRSSTHAKTTQAPALALSFRNDMLDFYRSLPLCYLKPLRAVLRKLSSSSPVQLTMPEFREPQAEEGGVAKASGGGAMALPIVALPPVVKTHVQHLKMEKAKVYEKSGAAPPPSYPAGTIDEAMEDEAKEAARLARRMRGGTPALFRSLGGDEGNYGSGDFKNSKAALAVNPFNIPRANLLVHLRRMRLALLGQDKAARVDKRQVCAPACCPGLSGASRCAMSGPVRVVRRARWQGFGRDCEARGAGR